MVAECRLAERLGWIGPDVDRPPDRPCSNASACRPPPRASTPTPCSTRWAATRRTRAGGSASSCPAAIGRVELTDAPGEADVRAVLVASAEPSSAGR